MLVLPNAEVLLPVLQMLSEMSKESELCRDKKIIYALTTTTHNYEH